MNDKTRAQFQVSMVDPEGRIESAALGSEDEFFAFLEILQEIEIENQREANRE